MRLLALTDIIDGKTSEFVVVEKIRHIQAFKQIMVNDGPTITEVLPRTWFQKLFGLTPTVVSKETTVERLLTGSTIFMDNGHTNVLETPENIANMLVEGNYLTIEKGE